MIRMLFPWDWGSDIAPPLPGGTNAPAWAHVDNGLPWRAFGTRTRGQDVWVETGSAWNDDPNTDTRIPT
jgi:hypothetical protein